MRVLEVFRTSSPSVRHLVPLPFRRAATGLIAERRASSIRRALEKMASAGRPILAGPWLGEVGFELLYWVPFLRWFSEEYRVPRERIIAVSRGGSAAAWYAPFASRSYDALAYMAVEDFRRRNSERSGGLGEQKQVAVAPLDAEIIDRVEKTEGSRLSPLHPSMMYTLFAPYWWGHRPIEWVRQFLRFVPLQPPAVVSDLPARYTAVKFYFNDCFRDTPETRAFVERTVRGLAEHGPVISLSTGFALDDHDACDPCVDAMRDLRSQVSPENNLLVQSGVVAGAQRFVGTYGGFAYLAPFCGVPTESYYTEPGQFSMRHLDLMRDVLRSDGRPTLLELSYLRGGVAD